MNIRFAHTPAFFLISLVCSTAVTLAQETKEAELIAILRSDAPKAEKAITCKHLAVHGTKLAVDELAELLPDPQLTSWARTALEAIPDPEADEALRYALVTMESGRPLIGVVNSIAKRRDEEAVDGLIERLSDNDEQVVIAAAIALGQIGNASAQQALERSLADESQAIRSAAAEGCILVAERLVETNRRDEAAALYKQVRSAEVPKQRVLEATRGLILTRKSADLLAEQLQSDDRDHFNLGLRTARELPDKGITNALVATLEQVEPLRQSLVVLSLAERDRESVMPAIMKIARSGSDNVRSSALQVLGRVGDVSAVETLLAAAAEDDATVAQSARDALATLEDAAVNEAIKRRLARSQDITRRVLIETIGARQINAIPELLDAAHDVDQSIRQAALAALGATVGPEDLAKLIALVTKPRHPEDSDIARMALRTASTRMPDRDICATQLASAMQGASLSTQSAILEILGHVGGKQALQTVAQAAADDRDALKDAASQALGKWMTPDAAPELLKLAQPKADDKYRIRALRGYLRIARQMKLTSAQRAQMCEEALNVAARDAERTLALNVLEIHPSIDTLAVALSARKHPALKDMAQETSLRVAGSIRGQVGAVRKLLEQGDLEPAKIEILQATYGAGEQSKDVTEVVQRSVGRLPIVSLTSESYNEAFDGDPAPGLVKQLVVKYKIDGRDAKASFRENAAIVLPRPNTQP